MNVKYQGVISFVLRIVLLDHPYWSVALSIQDTTNTCFSLKFIYLVKRSYKALLIPKVMCKILLFSLFSISFMIRCSFVTLTHYFVTSIFFVCFKGFWTRYYYYYLWCDNNCNVTCELIFIWFCFVLCVLY